MQTISGVMKLKKILAAMAAVALMLCASSAYAAAASANIWVNNQIGESPVAVASDVQPERKNGRTMVPLRVIGEHLGAKIRWTGHEAVLEKGGMKIILRPGSDQALVNAKATRLDAKPYLKNGRLMVPLRFVAETFDCEVNYDSRTGAVTIATKPVTIDGMTVASMQYEVFLTMGSIVTEITSNTHTGVILEVFEKSKGAKIEAPANAVPKHMMADVGDFYMTSHYEFVGLDGSVIRHYDLYTKYAGVPEEFLLYAGHEDQWYRFSVAAILDLDDWISAAAETGYSRVVSDTAA